MFKVMTIVGTRPELIKMSRVIAELDKHVNHLLVHTGQNYDYELNGLFFEDLGIRKPDYFLEAVGENAMQTIARVIEKSDAILEKEKRAIDLLLNTYHERKMHFIDICEHIQKMFQKFSIQYEPISTDVCNKKKMLKNMVDKYLLEHPNYEANVNNIYKLPDNTIPNTKKRKFTKNEIQQLYFNENE